MTAPVVWRTDDPCPVCAAALVLLGHGQPVQTAQCEACGYCERWDFNDDANGGDAQ